MLDITHISYLNLPSF